jgi:hypothetical protein
MILSQRPRAKQADAPHARPLGVLEANAKREQSASDQLPTGTPVSQGNGHLGGGDNAGPLLSQEAERSQQAGGNPPVISDTEADGPASPATLALDGEPEAQHG